jgi:AbrB family looped-hinge helix DNA binding protein
MQTRLSTKGQVVVPSKIRRKLGLRPGDSLDAKVAGEQIILIPQRNRSAKARIIRDEVTGLPVLAAGSGATELTSAEVREILADFP